MLKINSDANSYFDYAYLHVGSNFSNNYDPMLKTYLKCCLHILIMLLIFIFLDNQGNQLDRSYINNNQSEILQLMLMLVNLFLVTILFSLKILNNFMIGSCLQLEDLHSGIITNLKA